eukprot:TRINITY_DN2536_c1_g1_i2.p2 TRINITY_DN2536_c1_g1~~TRINITY_DN2536_c1_g1_i2.p2  ORF type:complete len:217 (+),score=-11.45 TRINITY_DN2536_c1_g1_i2:41-652(+)
MVFLLTMHLQTYNFVQNLQQFISDLTIRIFCKKLQCQKMLAFRISNFALGCYVKKIYKKLQNQILVSYCKKTVLIILQFQMGIKKLSLKKIFCYLFYLQRQQKRQFQYFISLQDSNQSPHTFIGQVQDGNILCNILYYYQRVLERVLYNYSIQQYTCWQYFNVQREFLKFAWKNLLTNFLIFGRVVDIAAWVLDRMCKDIYQF